MNGSEAYDDKAHGIYLLILILAVNVHCKTDCNFLMCTHLKLELFYRYVSLDGSSKQNVPLD